MLVHLENPGEVAGGARVFFFFSPTHTEGMDGGRRGAFSSIELIWIQSAESIYPEVNGHRHGSFQALGSFQKEMFMLVALHKCTLQKCIWGTKEVRESRRQYLKLSWDREENFLRCEAGRFRSNPRGTKATRQDSLCGENKRDIWAAFCGKRNTFFPV